MDYFQPLTHDELSPSGKPLEIDLGCGDGSFLRGMAANFSEREFLGVERLLGRVRKVARDITQQNLPNARVLRLDSRYVVEWLLPESSVARIHLLCPDPWPKAKHHRRRLFQKDFLAAVQRALIPSGEFLFMTDHPEYYDWALEEAREYGKFETLEWNESTFFYPKTDFQLHWESLGKPMHRLRLRNQS